MQDIEAVEPGLCSYKTIPSTVLGIYHPHPYGSLHIKHLLPL